MTAVKAAVCRAWKAPLSIETVHLRSPGAGEVEVTLGAVAICHSDIAYAEGYWGGTLPAVFGHEAAGRVSAVGPGVSGFKVGDAVVVTLLRACRSCPSCARGAPAICEAPPGQEGTITGGSGEQLVQAMHTGAFAERVVVDTSQIAPCPDGLAMDAASLLACGVLTGVGAVVNSGRLRAGEDVVVIGAGGVGLSAIQGARIAGARRIVAVDVVAEKLDDALAFGATHGVLATEGDPVAAARKALGRGADAVFVAVGAVAAATAAPDYLATGGRVVLVGMPPTGALAGYEPVNLASQGQSIIGSKMGDAVVSRDIPWLAELYAQGRLKLDEMISRRWRLDEINEAIADTKAGHAKRNVIVF